jgi:hypothetical protein
MGDILKWAIFIYRIFSFDYFEFPYSANVTRTLALMTRGAFVLHACGQTIEKSSVPLVLSFTIGRIRKIVIILRKYTIVSKVFDKKGGNLIFYHLNMFYAPNVA